MKTFAVLLAVAGAAAVAAGAALVYLPAGVVAGGVELLAAAYIIGYLEARR